MSGGLPPWRGLARLSMLRAILTPLASAIPSRIPGPIPVRHDADTDNESSWLYLVCAAILVLLGGAFAGLTIA